MRAGVFLSVFLFCVSVSVGPCVQLWVCVHVLCSCMYACAEAATSELGSCKNVMLCGLHIMVVVKTKERNSVLSMKKCPRALMGLDHIMGFCLRNLARGVCNVPGSYAHSIGPKLTGYLHPGQPLEGLTSCCIVVYLTL